MLLLTNGQPIEYSSMHFFLSVEVTISLYFKFINESNCCRPNSCQRSFPYSIRKSRCGISNGMKPELIASNMVRNCRRRPEGKRRHGELDGQRYPWGNDSNIMSLIMPTTFDTLSRSNRIDDHICAPVVYPWYITLHSDLVVCSKNVACGPVHG